MKAIIKRNLKNYLKNPIFWIGLIVVLISMYQTLAPYLSIHYVKSDETFRKVKMASDVSFCPNLVYINCRYNQLTDLRTIGDNNLRMIACQWNY